MAAATEAAAGCSLLGSGTGGDADWREQQQTTDRHTLSRQHVLAPPSRNTGEVGRGLFPIAGPGASEGREGCCSRRQAKHALVRHRHSNKRTGRQATRAWKSLIAIIAKKRPTDRPAAAHLSPPPQAASTAPQQRPRHPHGALALTFPPRQPARIARHALFGAAVRPAPRTVLAPPLTLPFSPNP